LKTKVLTAISIKGVEGTPLAADDSCQLPSITPSSADCASTSVTVAVRRTMGDGLLLATAALDGGGAATGVVKYSGKMVSYLKYFQILLEFLCK